ncbi:unnamed protein product [Peronospora belbahrii]|uniref:Uncharacterized protein n=1 Tax=Peronospora belbahrii TaxID=622444 RepID=A0AAU9KT15_9STRA|nr:unnamed protein product [Peronospora belbahrii]CAH0515452.1 unnamed protein product [Peronospora belbahrii]
MNTLCVPYTNVILYTDVEPVDVYKGCHIDYRGIEVTPETFVNVLLGNSSSPSLHRKVLQSTGNDRVSVNFIDHGSRGKVYFPTMKPLSASKLKETMEIMYEKNMYKELVFYMEACESGPMFFG